MLDVRKQNQEGFLKRPKYWTFVFDWVPFLSLVVLFYLQNQSIPMVYDDLPFGYMVCIPDELAPAGADIHYPIQKVSQIFQSQIYQYFHYNGRVFIHFFVQFFCGILGKNVFNIVTTIVFALLLYILPQLSFRKLASRWSILPLIMLLLCLHQPTCLVQGIAHSINYLWSLTIILSFIFLINSIIENNGCSFVKLFIVSVIGFFAGWAHEGLSLAISASFVAVVSDSIYKTRTISKSIIPILSFWLGTCGVVLAPGNFIRMDTMHRSALDSITLLWDNIGFQSLFLMGLFYMTAKITKQTIKNLLIENYFWLISLLIGILLPIFSGAIYSRAFFAFDISLLMLVCNLISHYKNECVVWMFRCSFLFIPLFGYFCFLQTQALDQFKSVEKQMSLGNVEIIKPEISIPDWAYLYVYHINTIPIYSPYYEDWLKNDFQMKVFRWYYQHPFDIVDEDLLNKLQKIKSGIGQKVPGKNDFFYVSKKMLLSDKKVNLESHFTLELGDYNINGIKPLLKKLYCYLYPIKNIKNNKIDVTFKVEEREILGDVYSFIDIGDPERQIMSLDYSN